MTRHMTFIFGEFSEKYAYWKFSKYITIFGDIWVNTWGLEAPTILHYRIETSARGPIHHREALFDVLIMLTVCHTAAVRCTAVPVSYTHLTLPTIYSV